MIKACQDGKKELWSRPRIDLEDERILRLLSMGLSLDCALLVRNYRETYQSQVKSLWMSRRLEYLWKMGLVDREPRSDSFLYSINEDYREAFRDPGFSLEKDSA